MTNCLPKHIHHFLLAWQRMRMHSQHLCGQICLDFSYSNRCAVVSPSFNFKFLITNVVEHLYKANVICMSLMKELLKFFIHFSPYCAAQAALKLQEILQTQPSH
jgi:hypothetical protein